MTPVSSGARALNSHGHHGRNRRGHRDRRRRHLRRLVSRSRHEPEEDRKERVSTGQEGSRLWESKPRPTHYEDDGRYPGTPTSTDRTSDATGSTWPPGRTPTEMPERMPTPTRRAPNPSD